MDRRMNTAIRATVSAYQTTLPTSTGRRANGTIANAKVGQYLYW